MVEKHIKITEEPSLYDRLDEMDTLDIVANINNEDKKVADAVERVLPQVARVVDETSKRFEKGGRLFYIGAGTSGRLGILDASEIPPTFGLPYDRVIGLIAGGDKAIRKAVEFAEDDTEQAWKDLQEYGITNNDVLIGIAASGTTPYVLGGIADAKKHGIKNGDKVLLETRRDKMVFQAKVSDVCRPGLVFVPWFDQNLIINKLTLNAFDKGSKQPEYKICAVRIKKA
ncbi:MAG: hypothetical protein DSY83_03805 [Flavobacteriia bacterium]|nr:MAG: hypothetical protein DSY83_03805 [Flavobacteriia bacterium]